MNEEFEVWWESQHSTPITTAEQVTNEGVVKLIASLAWEAACACTEKELAGQQQDSQITALLDEFVTQGRANWTHPNRVAFAERLIGIIGTQEKS